MKWVVSVTLPNGEIESFGFPSESDAQDFKKDAEKEFGNASISTEAD